MLVEQDFTISSQFCHQAGLNTHLPPVDAVFDVTNDVDDFSEYCAHYQHDSLESSPVRVLSSSASSNSPAASVGLHWEIFTAPSPFRRNDSRVGVGLRPTILKASLM